MKPEQRLLQPTLLSEGRCKSRCSNRSKTTCPLGFPGPTNIQHSTFNIYHINLVELGRTYLLLSHTIQIPAGTQHDIPFHTETQNDIDQFFNINARIKDRNGIAMRTWSHNITVRSLKLAALKSCFLRKITNFVIRSQIIFDAATDIMFSTIPKAMAINLSIVIKKRDLQTTQPPISISGGLTTRVNLIRNGLEAAEEESPLLA
jgi:hypothetical protein